MLKVDIEAPQHQLVEWLDCDRDHLGHYIADCIDLNSRIILALLLDDVWVVGLQSFVRGEGNGSKTLARLCEGCDRFGVSLRLEPTPYTATKSLDRGQLISWYSRYGFTISHAHGSYIEMIRKPDSKWDTAQKRLSKKSYGKPFS